MLFGSLPNSDRHQIDVSQTGQLLSENDVNMFRLFMMLEIDHASLSEKLDRDARQAINQLGTLPENPALNEIERCLASVKSQVKLKFRELGTKIIKVESNRLPKSPQIQQMLAVLLFHQYLSNNHPPLIENPIFEIIVEMGIKFVEATRRPEDDLSDFREVLILLILISKIYDAELQVLAFYSASAGGAASHPAKCSQGHHVQ